MSNKFFSIIVGDAPAKVQVGFLNQDTGVPIDPVDALIAKAGTAVPNYSRVWGILERNKKDELTGNIKYLPWGSSEGEIIEIRFLPTISSLSVEFQKLKKVTLQDKDSEILFDMGVNNYDPIRQKMLVEMLQHHYQNEENDGRDPSVPVAFKTYDPAKITKRVMDDVRQRQEVEMIMLDANYDNEALEILASLFNGIDPRQQQDILFAELMDLTKKPTFVLGVLEHHRKGYEEIMLKAKDVELIDCTDDAILIVKNGHKDFLLKGIEAGKEGALLHVLKHFYKPEYFKALNQVKVAWEAFQKTELQ
jgi:hypothetical protein